MANEKKYYSFLNITDGADGAKNCTAVLTLTRPSMRELQDGKKVLTCAAALSNCDKALSKALGVTIAEPGVDTVWCDIQFWNVLADRFQKFMGERDKVRLVVCGRLSLREWTTKDGAPAKRVQISVNDWCAFPAATASTSETSVSETSVSSDVMDELPF